MIDITFIKGKEFGLKYIRSFCNTYIWPQTSSKVDSKINRGIRSQNNDAFVYDALSEIGR